MKRVSGGPRRMGGSGMRGISRSSIGSRSSSSFKGYRSTGIRSHNNLNRHHSHMYRRYYGNSILPSWMRIIAYIVLGIIAIIIIFF